MEEIVNKFQSIGLSETKAKDTLKNKKLASLLEKVIDLTEDSHRKEVGTNLYTLASTITPDALNFLEVLVKKVVEKDLKSSDQINAAIKYFEDNNEIEIESFNKACGVGVEVSPDEIKRIVAKVIEENKTKLVEERYKAVFPLLGSLRKLPELKWANGGLVKEELDNQILALLGPKDERDAPVKKGKPKEKSKEAPKKTDDKADTAKLAEEAKGIEKDPSLASASMFFEGDLARLHKPGGNKQLKQSLMEEHLKTTGGIVRTRFPPEPNGFLHIGHAKAINVNFGYAQAHNGTCYLRYDDTNPEAEEEIYFTSILEAVKWLGFKPFKVTYSSDYFDELYALAVQMIKLDKAYACHCTGEEIFQHRGGESKGPRTECKHRNRPVEESLEEFKKMKEGKYKEGETILRMKMNLESGNPQFWDLVAYRVLYTPHHRTHDKWCIYPTYDFTHCLVDSFENITHSLCTTEFVQSRPSYYWLCDVLEVYKPVQWEYGRLSVTNTVLSKRKIQKLVSEKLVSGWDDPRLYTLPALRRRGVPPAAINSFVRDVGVTTASTVTDVKRLEGHIRDHLNKTVPRIMALHDPVEVEITNLSENHHEYLELPNKPDDPSMGKHQVPFTNRIFIDRSDFRTQDSKDYFRLAPGKSVGLLHVKHPIKCIRFDLDSQGTVSKVYAELEGADFKKPKTYIQWIASSPKDNSPVLIDELRVYDPLFLHENPQDERTVPGGYLTDINPNSLIVSKHSMVEVGIHDVVNQHYKKGGEATFLPEEVRCQFIRIGYFALDKDSSLPDKLVFNRIVTLKDSKKD